MSGSDRRLDSQYEASFSGRDKRVNGRGWADEGTDKRYHRNGGYKRDREDSRTDRDGERKKSRSRSPWEEKSPTGLAAPGKYVSNLEGDELRSKERKSSSRPVEPSVRGERIEKRVRSEPSLKEAGELPEEKGRERDSKRHRSSDRPHSKSSSRDGGRAPSSGHRRHGESSPGRSERRGPGREDRRTPSKGDQKPPTPTRLSAIPAEIRKAALEAQKREQERRALAAALIAAEEEEEAKQQENGEEVGEEKPALKKHSPIVWNAAKEGSAVVKETSPAPPKTAVQTAAATAALELEKFKESQQEAGFDPDAPAALKASPSVSGEEEEGEVAREEPAASTASAEEQEGVPQMAIRSRWLQDEEADEPLPLANGKEAARELADLEALDAAERLDLAGPYGNGEGEWGSDDESVSEFQATRRDISMLNSCRRVESYERLNRISEGTYGVVYRARDKETGVICALKRIKMEKEKEGFPLTSIREINILLSFQHPNIVDVSEVVVGDSLDQIFMVMEFMEHDLKGLMDDMTQPFTVAETKNLMRQLLEGMAYLHSNWVLHRDLKTSNILYNNRGQLKICDFGLARQYGSPLRPYTHNVVTQYYRAIELLLGCEQYSTAIDIWSLGCIMVELLTKKVLFQGTSELDQIDRIFRVMGSPTEENWPGYKKLPNVQKLKLKVQPKTLRSLLPAASKFDPNSGLTEAGMNLLESMLSLDPSKRISAQAALDHPWFKEQPYAKDNAMMPTYPTSKDGSSRSSRQRLHKKASPDLGGPNFASRKLEIGMLFGRK